MTRHLAMRTPRRLLVLPASLVGAARRAGDVHAVRPIGELRGASTFDTWLDQQR